MAVFKTHLLCVLSLQQTDEVVLSEVHVNVIVLVMLLLDDDQSTQVGATSALMSRTGLRESCQIRYCHNFMIYSQA